MGSMQDEGFDSSCYEKFCLSGIMTCSPQNQPTFKFWRTLVLLSLRDMNKSNMEQVRRV